MVSICWLTKCHPSVAVCVALKSGNREGQDIFQNMFLRSPFLTHAKKESSSKFQESSFDHPSASPRRRRCSSARKLRRRTAFTGWQGIADVPKCSSIFGSSLLSYFLVACLIQKGSKGILWILSNLVPLPCLAICIQF